MGAEPAARGTWVSSSYPPAVISTVSEWRQPPTQKVGRGKRNWEGGALARFLLFPGMKKRAWGKTIKAVSVLPGFFFLLFLFTVFQ
ncbi:MAG TPA: hypothetical protein PKO38_01110 [Bacillota bacterium]|nr:hypothetical protein [Bacillota bacterium]HOB86270.1 hypothetical protein [Bacillota bacterium]HPT34168.1 hypothetical protein [Bacillota bacterium]HQD05981.1 hypothetical protein [Bacillota bacterium]